MRILRLNKGQWRWNLTRLRLGDGEEQWNVLVCRLVVGHLEVSKSVLL